jgi:hypothetical protein
MKKLTVRETTDLFHSHGLKCDPKIIENWLVEGKLMATESGKGYIINEKDAYEFLYDYRWEGTAYERGIDNQTKIERLEKVIKALIEEKQELHEKILDLEIKLGISPFD